MRKFILFSALILSGTLWAANPSVWRSSSTATADTTQNLCVNRRGFLHGVIVSSGTSGNSTFIAYASSATTANPMISTIDTSQKASYVYDVAASTRTGLTYSTVGTAQVTILFDCY